MPNKNKEEENTDKIKYLIELSIDNNDLIRDAIKI